MRGMQRGFKPLRAAWLRMQYDGDFRPKLDAVREELNAVAEGWTREQKDQCLQETEKSFAYSGGLLRTIMAAAG